MSDFHVSTDVLAERSRCWRILSGKLRGGHPQAISNEDVFRALGEIKNGSDLDQPKEHQKA